MLAHSNAAEKDLVALRTEAVACLTAPDLQREPSLPISEPSLTIFRPEDDPLWDLKLPTGAGAFVETRTVVVQTF